MISREPPSDRGEVFKVESGRRYQRTFLKLDWGNPAPAAIKQGGVYLIAGGSIQITQAGSKGTSVRARIPMGVRPVSEPSGRSPDSGHEDGVR